MKSLAQFLLVLFLAPFTALADPAPVNLLPTPKSVRWITGEMPLSKTSRIVATDPSLQPLAEIFSEEIQLATQLKLKTTNGSPQPGDIVLKIN
ncbi:MAG: hypothetical protein NTX04_02570, partial [Verrucomicrobia bacterium]|nr:hypothetical protein [Verrucomicrobiota bacterium]